MATFQSHELVGVGHLSLWPFLLISFQCHWVCGFVLIMLKLEAGEGNMDPSSYGGLSQLNVNFN